MFYSIKGIQIQARVTYPRGRILRKRHYVVLLLLDIAGLTGLASRTPGLRGTARCCAEPHRLSPRVRASDISNHRRARKRQRHRYKAVPPCRALARMGFAGLDVTLAERASECE